MTSPSLILMVYTGENVMHVGPVSIWSAGRKALVIKFNGTTGSIVVSMWLSGALLCVFLFVKLHLSGVAGYY